MLVRALFLFKLLANAMAPLALLRRPRGPNGEEPGVSLMPYVEVVLLVLLLGLAIVGWAPVGPTTTALSGVAAMLGSYLLMFFVSAVLARFGHLFGRRR